MQSVLILFILGVFLLLFSTEIFVKMAQKISVLFRISPLIIGITIVAVGTSLPELSVSLIAAIKHDSGLALGNIIGSNIVNIFLVLPVGILLGKIKIGTIKTQRNSFLLLLATLLFVLIMTLFHFPPIAGLILLSFALLFTVGEYIWGVRGRKNEDKLCFTKNNCKFRQIDLMLLLFSLAGILTGGSILVNSVEKISFITGLSTTILGLSLTAIATSMPELLTTLITLRSKEEKMALGNIIGSNIYNLLLVGGLIALTTPVIVIPGIDWSFLLLATASLSLLIFAYKGRVIPKKYGVFLLIFFFIYILSLGKL